MNAKSCEARCVISGHDRAVLLEQVNRLETLRHAIKREWQILLRQEPAASALANPDTLVHLMDNTLNQLFSGLHRTNEEWLRRSARINRPLREICPCALNPLLVYFSTGQLALRAAANRDHADDMDEILLLFHALAQEEINALCSVCQHREEPGCAPGPRKCAGLESALRCVRSAPGAN
ncbi:MAG TPA: hypothetical protein VFJ90_01530 [Candidatus Didemnitutus sp.]|nr:hypothetical protein [Candidatus Didemnitutus sp.]